MPVDRPSMIATVVETAMLKTAASAVIPVTVMATPMSALRIGSRPAMSELNVISSAVADHAERDHDHRHHQPAGTGRRAYLVGCPGRPGGRFVSSCFGSGLTAG
jgi:hypothetical protein